MAPSSVLFCVLVMCVLSNSASDKPSKLKIEVTKTVEGCTRKTHNGDTVHMHYTGKLDDGTKFDSSRDRDEALEFELGAGMVIQGWERGLLDMCVGEHRSLIIPPSLGYGDRGAPPVIPAGATLHFDVELVHIAGHGEGEL